MAGHGTTHGVKHSRLHVVKHNVYEFASAAPPGVTTDGPSNVYVPQSQADFTALGLGTWTNLYLCQEASGNMLDTIGSVTLTAVGSPLYQQTVSGWTRKALEFNQAAAQRFSVGAGSGPNPGSTSVAWLVYCKYTGTPSANRRLWCPSDIAVTNLQLVQTTANKAQLVCNSVGTNSVSSYNDSTVHPFLIVFDRTNLLVRLYTELEQVNGTYSALVADGTKGFGATSGTSCLAQVVWAAMTTGANAEALGKTTLSTLGWTLSY